MNMAFAVKQGTRWVGILIMSGLLTLAFLVPVVAVFLMPGAVAGATLLARDLTGDPRSGENSGGAPDSAHGPVTPPALTLPPATG